MRIIANVFGARRVSPRAEALAGEIMVNAVAKERRRGGDAKCGYVPASFSSPHFAAARRVVLDMLAAGPAMSSEMLPNVALRRQQLFSLLGAMRAEGVITGERPDKAHAAVWRLAEE